MIQCQLPLNQLQLLVAVITLLNNLVSDEDVRLTVIKLPSRNKRKDLQVGDRLLCICMVRCTVSATTHSAQLLVMAMVCLRSQTQ
jgi:hypothetical protein